MIAIKTVLEACSCCTLAERESGRLKVEMKRVRSELEGLKDQMNSHEVCIHAIEIVNYPTLFKEVDCLIRRMTSTRLFKRLRI